MLDEATVAAVTVDEEITISGTTVRKAPVDLTFIQEALDSIRDVVTLEFNELIDLAASLETGVDQQEFAETEKQRFLNDVRTDFDASLKQLLSEIHTERGRSWQAIEAAFPGRFPSDPELISRKGLCPPGMIEENGVCVLIGRPVPIEE